MCLCHDFCVISCSICSMFEVFISTLQKKLLGDTRYHNIRYPPATVTDDVNTNLSHQAPHHPYILVILSQSLSSNLKPQCLWRVARCQFKSPHISPFAEVKTGANEAQHKAPNPPSAG